jgi:hypothetical protein
MSENAGNENDQQSQPEVERETVTETTSAEVPNHEDPREELRTPDPEVQRETVTETVSESPDDAGDNSSQDSEGDGNNSGSEPTEDGAA